MIIERKSLNNFSIFCFLVLWCVPAFSSADSSFMFKPVAPSRNSQFIAALYSDLLNRTPSADEVSPFLGALKQGTTRAAVAQTIIVSSEFRTSLIQELYSSYLDRAADAASISAFLTLYQNGGDTFDVRRLILGSDEYFANKGNGTLSGFVSSLYKDLLGRTPTQTELTQFVRLIDSVGRSAVVQTFLTSSEFNSGLIGLLYKQFLGRSAQNFENSAFLALLQANKTEDDLRAAILGSDEFYQKVAPPFMTRSARRFFLGSVSRISQGVELGSLKGKINWGDGHSSAAEIEDAGDGSVRVFGTHNFKRNAKFRIIVSLTLNGEVVRRAVNLSVASLLTQISPFSADSKVAVRVAAGDVNGDGAADLIVAAGPGAGPHVKVYDGTSGKLLSSFFAFDSSFTGGVFVAAGDVNGDGKADIIAGAGPGGGPQVKVFNAADGSLLDSFLAFDPSFKGGVSVAAGDVNGDGKADIIAGAGPGGGPQAKVFNAADLSLLSSFFAFDSSFTGGVFVAAGDVNGDGLADIITGAGPGGGPHVKVFSGADTSELKSFDAFGSAFGGGVRVAAGDLNGDGKSDLIVSAGPGGGPHVKVFGAVDDAVLKSFDAFSPSFTGGVFVAAADLNGDGKAEIFSGTGGGTAPLVSIKR